MGFSFNERIERIGDYFKGFNVVDGLMIAFVVFPDNWIQLEEEYINKTYNVSTSKNDGGVYFVTEIKNGSECLFDAIDNVISVNKSLEEKTNLLKIKAKELKDLFLVEPLDKLKTLEFTFKTKSKRVRKVKEEVINEKEKSEVIEEKVEEKNKAIIADKPKVNNKNKTAQVKKKKDGNSIVNKKKKEEVVDKKSDISESMSFIMNEISK